MIKTNMNIKIAWSMNYKIIMDNAIAKSTNDNINIDSTKVG